MPRPRTTFHDVAENVRFVSASSSTQGQDMNENWEDDTSVVVEYEEGVESEAGRGRGKAREANLTAECLVCGGAAAAHQHYGAICCYSCRAFFRRGILRNYSCVRADNSCQVNSITRTNCKKCRFARCLEVGMRPELVDASLRRKQEEKRRQEILDIQQEMGIQTVEDLESESQAVTGMMQLHQGLVQGDHSQQAVILQHQNSHSVIQAVQGLQEPLPRHLLAQHVGQLSPGSVGRKKVLLELRHNEAQRKAGVERIQTVQLMEPQPQSPPLRQQTYYIFHPVTQTFEPITIAEFEENAVVEEVVVGDESMDKMQEDDIAEAEQHHPELSEENNLVSQVEKSRKGKKLSEAEEEQKPVISPVVREIQTRPVALVSEPRQEIKISRKESKHSHQTSVIKKLSDKLIEDTVNDPQNGETRQSSDLSRVIEETIGEKGSFEAMVMKERDDETDINIEALVDVCFKEELCSTGESEEGNDKKDEGLKRKFSEVKSESALLPLKKRKTNDNDKFAATTDVEIFSHKIVHPSFTSEESLKLNKLREVLNILKNSRVEKDNVTCVLVTRLLKQVEDLRQPLTFNSSLSSIIQCSTSSGPKQYRNILGQTASTGAVVSLFSSDDRIKALIFLLKMLTPPSASFVSRNLLVLLYRYLTSIITFPEAAIFLRVVQMILHRV